jgi:prolipoprotein diacylglyceryltransferase
VLTWLFIGLYGWIRFGLMFVRDEARVWMDLTLSQVFSGLMGILGTVMLLVVLLGSRNGTEGEPAGT